MGEDAQIAGDQTKPIITSADTAAGNAVSIPDHELIRCIGRGSYGEVWLARNMMGVFRAVKVVYRKSFSDQRPFDRELSGIRKFEPLSRSHEGFVDILHIGISADRGYFYYVMEIGDDQDSGQVISPQNYSPKTLAKAIRARSTLSLEECLKLGLALSAALAELHEHGLVHRDVKPSNIIFVNGVPKLADIGLVADASEARSYVGTEGFIPPEGPGSPQADVYSLGKVLYEASTGKDRLEFPELPTLSVESPDHDRFLELNEVVLRACKVETTDRYASAWDLHADLLLITNGKSVKRLKLLERRLTSLKRIVTVGGIALFVTAGISYHLYRERKAKFEIRHQKIGGDIAYGNRAMESGDLLSALPYFVDALRLDQGHPADEAIHRLRLGSVLDQVPILTRLWSEGRRVDDAEFSMNGKYVLVTPYYGKVKIYDLDSGRLHGEPFGPSAGLARATFSPDNKLVAAASEANTVEVWSADNFQLLSSLPHKDSVFSVKFGPKGAQVVTAGYDGTACVWQLLPEGTNRLLFELRHGSGVLFADFSHDGRFIVTAGYDKTARLWNTRDGQPAGPPLLHDNWVTYAAFSPDDGKLVTASFDRKARVWEVPTGKRVPLDMEHLDGVKSAEFSPDGRLIVTASLDGTARLWLADSLKPFPLIPILRHGERITRAAFSPDGHRIVTTGADGTVCVWDIAPAIASHYSLKGSVSRDGSRTLGITNRHLTVSDVITHNSVGPPIAIKQPVEKATLNRNGRFLVSTSLKITPARTNRLVEVWDVATGKSVGSTISISTELDGAVLCDDGTHLVTFGKTNALVWGVGENGPLRLLLPEKAIVRSVCFSSDGHKIAIPCGTAVYVWSADTGQLAFSPLVHSEPLQHVEFSPDNLRLVSCCADNQFTKCYAQVWSATTGAAIGPQLKHGDGVVFACFSPDNAQVATACEDFTASVWNVSTGQQVFPALRHNYWIRTVAFGPDGQMIVTASSDRSARVWNAKTGDPFTPPLRHTEEVASATFLPDGRSVVTIDLRGRARRWPLRTDSHKTDDLVLLAALLSGNSVTPIAQLSSASTESIWQRLRANCPSDFVTPTEKIAAWHEFQADESEIKKDWTAVIFHLGRLLALQPDEQSIIQRIDRARQHLQQ